MAWGDAYYTQDWYRLQDSVLENANGRCSDCGWPAIVAHHKTYADGILCHPKHLVALCKGCHDVRHGRSVMRREPYVDFMARRGWRLVAEHERWTMKEPGYCWVRR